jgi:hypothetical protein
MSSNNSTPRSFGAGNAIAALKAKMAIKARVNGIKYQLIVNKPLHSAEC